MDIPETRLLTMEQVADQLQISRSKAYELAANGALPTVRIGRCRRVRRDDLVAWAATLGASE